MDAIFAMYAGTLVKNSATSGCMDEVGVRFTRREPFPSNTKVTKDSIFLKLNSIKMNCSIK